MTTPALRPGPCRVLAGWLGDRCAGLADRPSLRSERALLLDIAHHAVEPLRVAVTGDVSTGKSTLVNALLGSAVAEVQRAETTNAVTWFRDPALAVPPPLGASHRQRATTFPLSGSLVLADTPGVNTASPNQQVTEAMLSAGTQATGSATVLVYLVEGTLSTTALQRIRSFSALASGLLDDGTNIVLGGSKADGCEYPGEGLGAGTPGACAALERNLRAEGGRFVGHVVALMPALAAACRTGVLDERLAACIVAIAGSDDLLDAAADGWSVLRATDPAIAAGLPAEALGSTVGVQRAAELLRSTGPADATTTIRQLWASMSGIEALEDTLRGLAAYADVLTVPVVVARLRRLATRLGSNRGAPVADVVAELRKHPGMQQHQQRYAAMLLCGDRMPHVPEAERRAAVAMLLGGPCVGGADAARWRVRASRGGRAVRDQRVAEIVVDTHDRACGAVTPSTP